MRSRNRDPIQILGGFKDSVTSVDTSKQEIVTGSVDGHVRVHDLRTGQCHADRLGYPVTSASLSNDGNCLLASCLGLGGAVVLIEKATGEKLNTYTGHAHKQYGLQSCLTHDDASVASGSEDGKVYVWDLVTGDQAKLNGHTRSVVGVAPHPKESLLISCSNDRTAVLWGR